MTYSTSITDLSTLYQPRSFNCGDTTKGTRENEVIYLSGQWQTSTGNKGPQYLILIMSYYVAKLGYSFDIPGNSHTYFSNLLDLWLILLVIGNAGLATSIPRIIFTYLS